MENKPGENNENIEKQKKNTGNINNLFLKKFIDDVKSNSSQNEINEFVKDTCEQSEMKPEIKDKMETFKLRNEEEFDEVSLEKISNAKLRMMLIRDFISFKTAKSNYIGEITRSYKLSDKEIEKIKKELDKKSAGQIDDLAKDIGDSEKFLEKTLKKIPNSFDYSDILSGINQEDIDKRLKNLKKDKRKLAEEALGNIVNLNFNASDFKLLFESGFLKKEEKLLLLKKYNSSISLSLAVSYGLLSKSEAETLKEKTLKDIFNEKKSGLNIGRDEFNTLKDKIKLSDIEVDVLSLGSSEKKIDDFVIEKNGLQKLDKELENFKKESEKERKESGAKDLKEFKKVIQEKYPQSVENLDLFEKGNYLKISKRDNNGKEEEAIYEIISNDDGNMGFQSKLVGNSKKGVDVNSNSEGKTTSYKEILTALDRVKAASGTMVLNFVSKKDFYNELNNPESSLKSSEYSSYSKSILDNEDTKNEITGSFKGNLETEINNLKTELENLKKDEKGNLGKIKDLEDLIQSKESRLNSLNSNSGDDLINSLNLERLISDIDSIDPNGKRFGLTRGIFIEAGKSGIAEIYSIDSEKQEIVLKLKAENGKDTINSISFASFYEGFKKNELKRSKKINDFGEFIEELRGAGVSGITNKSVFKDGKFIEKDEDETKRDQEIEYFVSNDGKQIVRINSIDGDKVNITLGEREKKEDKGKKKKEVLSLQKKSETLSLNEFKKGILEREMVPDWKIGKNGKAQELHEDIKGSFMSRYLKMLSVSDLLAAGKMFIDNIPEHLKRGSDAASARLALKWGKYLPDDLRHSLQIKVETFETEEMQKALDGLGKIDSKDATEKIKKWLKNKDAPAYKIEAAMLFMVEKYGHLTAKGPLYGYRGKFLWYQALGGRVGDELYNQIQEQARNGEKSFTEEELVYILINKQCKEKGGYNGIKRRSRLYKELEGKKGAGINAEIEKGLKDAKGKNTLAEKIKGGIDEARTGTTANSIGWGEGIIEKSGNLKDMNKLFFCLLYSGALYNVEGELYNKIKGLYEGKKMPVIMALMSRNLPTINNTRNVILDIAKAVEREYPDKHKGILEKATKIFNDATAMEGNAEKKFDETVKFFDDHGEPIIRALNMAHDDNTTYSKTDKILIFERHKNPKFQSYLELTEAITNENTFDKAIMTDDLGKVGVTGLKPIDSVKKWLCLNGSNNKFAEEEVAGIVWNDNINKDIKATKDKILEPGGTDVNSPRNRQMQREYLTNLLRQVFGGIKGKAPSDIALDVYNNLPYIGPSLRARGLIPLSKCLGGLSGDEIVKGEDETANYYIDEAINRILSGATDASEDNSVTDILGGIKNNVSNIQNGKSDD